MPDPDPGVPAFLKPPPEPLETDPSEIEVPSNLAPDSSPRPFVAGVQIGPLTKVRAALTLLAVLASGGKKHGRDVQRAFEEANEELNSVEGIHRRRMAEVHHPRQGAHDAAPGATHRMVFDFNDAGTVLQIQHGTLDGSDLGWADHPESKYRKALEGLRRAEGESDEEERFTELLARHPELIERLATGDVDALPDIFELLLGVRPTVEVKGDSDE